MYFHRSLHSVCRFTDFVNITAVQTLHLIYFTCKTREGLRTPITRWPQVTSADSAWQKVQNFLRHSQSHLTFTETIILTWGNSHFLSWAFERFAESVQPPVCPHKVQGKRVSAKSFPLFGLNPVKTSQGARGLIRCGDTVAAGGVTRKAADRSLNITHTSCDLPFGQAAGAWSLLCLQGQYVFGHHLNWELHTNTACTRTHRQECVST